MIALILRSVYSITGWPFWIFSGILGILRTIQVKIDRKYHFHGRNSYVIRRRVILPNIVFFPAPYFSEREKALLSGRRHLCQVFYVDYVKIVRSGMYHVKPGFQHRVAKALIFFGAGENRAQGAIRGIRGQTVSVKIAVDLHYRRRIQSHAVSVDFKHPGAVIYYLLDGALFDDFLDLQILRKFNDRPVRQPVYSDRTDPGQLHGMQAVDNGIDFTPGLRHKILAFFDFFRNLH